jgi:glycerol-3-phosphate dehydrogenase
LTTLIIGGGIAGLWLCDALRRRGDSVLLLESAALGAGQTIASQGIIHGGVKYALAGAVSDSAANIAEMPSRWRDALAGRTEPDLRGVPLRADHCHLWQTAGVRATLGMAGARLALEVTPTVVPPDQRPAALQGCPGTVARIAEPVVDVGGVLEALARRNAGHLLRVAEGDGVAFQRDHGGRLAAVVVRAPERDRSLTLEPGAVVLAAGAGNAELRRRAGLGGEVMQRRPLHMVMVRGALPVLNGHCVDGARTRATITTVADAQGRTVWLVGGQVAEEGVEMSGPGLLVRARHELEAILPGVDFDGTAWASYRIDRAERAMAGGHRPDDVQFLQEENLFTVWPTKLALAPRLADRLLPLLSASPHAVPAPTGWPVPAVATPPWDQEAAWTDAR